MSTQTVGYKAKAFEARNLIFYFLIAFLPVFVAVLVAAGILDFPSNPGPGLKILFAVAQFSPLIAALVVTATTEGKAGLKALWKRLWNRDLSIKWLLVILLFNPMVRLIANLISRAAGGEHYPFLEQPNILPLLLSGLIIGIQEEVGWRGYVLPRFQARWGALTSSIILGAIWAPYHIGGWLIPGERTGSFWEFSLWIILISIFTTWIFNNTNGSILAAVLFHAIVTNGIVGCCGVSWAMELLLGIYLVAAIIIVAIFGPKKLVRQKPEEATPFTALTERELEVLKLIARGYSNDKIAEQLVISVGTVKGHVSNILSKLHLVDRTQAAAYAWQEGIVHRAE